MGGKAMALHNVETERKTTSEHLRIQNELIPIISNMFNTEVKGVKFYHTKETHGDCDLLILNNGNLGNVVEKLKEKFGIVHNNGNVFSFEYDKYQIDIIPQPVRNWETAQIFFDYDPTGNLMGKTAHHFGLKYGFEGLVYPFRGFSGREVADIVISKDNKKIFNFLGFDYDRYLKGFDTLEEIYEYIINSKYFNPKGFMMDELNHIDRKRNKKRMTYQGFLEYLNSYTKELPSYNFNKDKSVYIDLIDKYFIESNFKTQLNDLTEKNNIYQKVITLFNGNLVMEWTRLKDKELGNCITEFKKYITESSNLDFNTWVLYVGAVDNVKDDFLKWFHKNV